MIMKDELLQELRQLAVALGSQSRLAAKMKVTPAYLSDILNGHRGITPRVLDVLGYEEVIQYRKIEKEV